MSELRAPDPTLTALGANVVSLTDVVGTGPLVAHHRATTDRPHPRGMESLCARDAAYIAIPCRTCFPDAPPPGCEGTADAYIGRWHLSWQTGDDT